MKHSKAKKTEPKKNFSLNTSQIGAIMAALVVLVVGYVVISGRASGFFASVDVESGTVSGNAQVVSDSSAYGGKAILFQAPATTPPPSGGGSGTYPAQGTVGYQSKNCPKGVVTISSQATLASVVAADAAQAAANNTPRQLPDSLGLSWDSAGYLDLKGSGGTMNCVVVKGGLTSNVSGTLKITNSVIEGGNVSWLIMAFYSGGLDIEDSTVRWKTGEVYNPDGTTYNPTSTGTPVIADATGHSPANVKIIRNDISGNGDGLGVTGSGWIITDNWIHNLSRANGNHNDGIQIYGGTNILIARNRIEADSGSTPHVEPNSAIFTQDSNNGTVTIDSNFLNGGAYVLTVEDDTLNVTNNVFGPTHYYGLVSVTKNGKIGTWTNNCKGDTYAVMFSPCQAVAKP